MAKLKNDWFLTKAQGHTFCPWKTLWKWAVRAMCAKALLLSSSRRIRMKRWMNQSLSKSWTHLCFPSRVFLPSSPQLSGCWWARSGGNACLWPRQWRARTGPAAGWHCQLSLGPSGSAAEGPWSWHPSRLSWREDSLFCQNMNALLTGMEKTFMWADLHTWRQQGGSWQMPCCSVLSGFGYLGKTAPSSSSKDDHALQNRQHF